MDIEIFYTPHTRSTRPRWLLEELQQPYNLRHIDLFGGERNPAHPLGSVPSVNIDGETLIESGAICHQLADSRPEMNLAPATDSPLRAQYEQWMFFVAATLEPPAMDILLHTQILPEKKRITAVVPFATGRYRQILRMLEKELDHPGYLLGKEFSCADIMLVTTLTWLPELLDKHPALQDYVKRLTARPAYQRAIQPTEEAA